MDKAKVAIEARELFKKWVATLTDEDIDKILGAPNFKRREQVRDLAMVLFQTPLKNDEDRLKTYAETFLDWVEKQLPKHSPYSVSPSYHDGYHAAISDVRKNLGLDS